MYFMATFQPVDFIVYCSVQGAIRIEKGAIDFHQFVKVQGIIGAYQ